MAGGNPALMLKPELFEAHYRKWVAVPNWDNIDSIITSSEYASIAYRDAQKKGHGNPLVFFVFDEGSIYKRA